VFAGDMFLFPVVALIVRCVCWWNSYICESYCTSVHLYIPKNKGNSVGFGPSTTRVLARKE
jgi:hypothetical protein